MESVVKRWFAARTRNGQTLFVRSLLEKYSVEKFIPTVLKVREKNKRRQTVEVPVIPNLVFIYATKEQACALANDFRIPLFYIRDSVTRSMLVVPDKQMRDFMQVWDLSPDSLCISKTPLTKGCKVRVVKGEFSGIEGEMLGMATRTYVILRIGDLLEAKIKVPKGYLMVIK